MMGAPEPCGFAAQLASAAAWVPAVFGLPNLIFQQLPCMHTRRFGACTFGSNEWRHIGGASSPAHAAHAELMPPPPTAFCAASHALDMPSYATAHRRRHRRHSMDALQQPQLPAHACNMPLAS